MKFLRLYRAREKIRRMAKIISKKYLQGGLGLKSQKRIK
jgi:hypothetical protein